MFTGIVTDIGTVSEVSALPEGKRLRIKTAYDPETIDIGASISCSGTCLTVVERGTTEGANWFEVEAWEEALRLTTIGAWTPDSRVNLERAMKAGDEYGGHMVSGHVDGQAKIVDVRDEGDARRFVFEVPDELAKYIAPKGSVALDGTSLTVNGVDDTHFDVLLIRHSLSVTTWADRKVGDRVNIEIDQIARLVERYVDRLAQTRNPA
ncbi:MAG: riboflavin synthase [Pseudomonadota bacterium]